ncbi:hypothetical protein V2J09_016788 [Rumex salicifolius]
MANRSITSITALHNQQLVVAEAERRSWDWEVVEDEDLYADVDSLESFSISSGDQNDEQEQQSESEGVHDDQDEIHAEFGGSNSAILVLGQDLEVTRFELHRRFDSGVGAFYSADSCENDVVGEPFDRDVVLLVDPLGLHIGSGRSVVPHQDEDDKGIQIHEDEDGSEYESDVDDQLVPWGVADRLDKQRMRKLGKRTCARMNKSKKMAHLYTKSACLHDSCLLLLQPVCFALMCFIRNDCKVISRIN